MLKSITKYRVTPYRYELWGNLKDGFDVNNEYSCPNSQQNFLKPPTVKQITGIAKNAFEGFSFALSEGESVCIPRNSIKGDSSYNNNISTETEFYFEYRGQQIGYVKIEQFQEFPKHYIACLSREDGLYETITMDPCASYDQTLKIAKRAAEAAGYTYIAIDRIERGKSTSCVEFGFRNKGDEYIGLHGDKAPSTGWYNLSK